jgi:Tc5 transposase DNA-binding domain/helix-turn-helix, Psq domain
MSEDNEFQQEVEVEYAAEYLENCGSESEDQVNEENPKTGRGKYQKYNNESLSQAIQDIKDKKLSINSAAKKYAVPKSTIFSRLKHDDNTKPWGRTPTLTAETERKLAEWLKDCQKMGDPRTREELINAAAELGKLTSDETKYFKNGIPSASWLKGFLKRNPDISFRTPSSVTRASANVSAGEIIKFINNFRAYLINENLSHLLDDPTAWGNSDETGVEYNPVPQQVLGEKGSKVVYRVETSKPKERVTFMYTFIASGISLTPQIILKKPCTAILDVGIVCGGKFLNFKR